MNGRTPSRKAPEDDLISGQGRVLVVDDDAQNRRLLRMMLSAPGYTVREATDGLEAVEACREEVPDLILMDIMMPGLDGYEATERIRHELGEHFVPIIFLTALSDEEALRKGIRSGGDDFLSKPLNLPVLKAKIHAMERLRDLQSGLQQRNLALLRAQARQAWEEETAESLFSRAITRRNHGADRLHLLHHAAATFNGDVILSDFTPEGALRLLIGDFTGHGLAAAIGAYPVSEAFHTLTQEGVGDDELLHHLNHVLHDFLPPAMFMGALLVTFSPDASRVRVWNGGMPDAWLCNRARASFQRLSSRAMPLGILPHLDLETGPQDHELQPGDWLLLVSDGVIEATNRAGAAFDEAALIRCCETEESAESAFERLRGALDDHCEEQTPTDDLTLVTINCGAEVVMEDRHPQNAGNRGSLRWSLAASDQQLAPARLVAAAHQQVEQWMPDLGEGHAEAIRTVIAELCNNAFEHGVLRLDSAMKGAAEGFDQYYRERAAAMEHLRGRIGISLRYHSRGEDHYLRIRVRDSGPGFDHARVRDTLETCGEERLWGRGLRLVNRLCSRVRYLGAGNQVEAEYHWQGRPEETKSSQRAQP